MNVSLPNKLKKWAEARVAEGSYASTSDYVRDLVRRDQQQEEERSWLQAEIDKGRASPILEQDAFEVIDEIIARAKDHSEAA